MCIYTHREKIACPCDCRCVSCVIQVCLSSQTVCAVKHKRWGAVLGSESWLCEGVEKGWVQQKILIFLFCFSQLGDWVAVNI